MAANENLFRAILELDVEFSKTSKGLDEVAKQYGKVNDIAEKNRLKLQELANDEAKILEARSKSNNPSVLVRYNNELKNVQGQIKTLTAEQNKLTQAEKNSAKEADNLNKSLKNAFTTTQLAAMKKELKALGVEFSSVSSGAKTFLKDSQKVEKVTDAFRALKLELKAAKGELAAAFASGNQAAITKASEKVDDLKDSLTNLSQTGSKLERLPVLFGDITRNIFSLDFGRANAQSKQLLATTKSITFAEAAGGLKDLGSTLLNLGKSLLVNPIFLLGATVFALWKSFDSFNESAARTKEILKGIDEAIKQIDADTQALNRATRDLTLQNELDAKKITKVTAEKLKAQNQFKDEYLAIVKKTQDEEKKLIDATSKAREDDGFKGTKNLLDKLGIETEDTKNQREGLKRIQQSHNKEIIALQEKYKAENTHILIDQANEEEKKRKEANDKLKSFLEAEFNLRKSFNKLLLEADLRNTEFFNKERAKNGSNSQIQLEFDARRNIAKLEFAAREEEINNQISAAQKEGLLTKKLQENFAKDRVIIAERLSQDLIQLTQEEKLAIINNDVKNGLEKIEIEKKINNDILLTSTESSEKIAVAKVSIEKDAFDKTIKILLAEIEARKLAVFDVVEQEKKIKALRQQNSTDIKTGTNDVNQKNFDAAIKQIDDKERHEGAALKLRNARQSTQLSNDLKFEKQKLDLIETSLGKETELYKDQADKVKALEKESIKQRRLEIIAFYEQISQAAIAATNKIIDTKIKEIETQTNLQQKRVDEAKGIADQGNAELLELEKERLDNLNKEKEKFVRAQQALAAIELISNTAIAVSKAAAEGGAAAGITIAAALLALVAGLASARSIASQAAFYDGGYTGDGNPRETSTAIGKKNYTYHKGEFVFDHEKTGKYRDIFEAIHKDKLDLGEMYDKATMFDYFKNLTSMNTGAPVFMPPSVVNSTVEISELKSQMSELIVAVRNQQTSVSLDKRGFAMTLKNVVDRDNFLSKEAKA